MLQGQFGEYTDCEGKSLSKMREDINWYIECAKKNKRYFEETK